MLANSVWYGKVIKVTAIINTDQYQLNNSY